MKKANSTLRASRAVPHPSTDRAFRRLTSEFGWDRVYSTKYGRWRKPKVTAGSHNEFRLLNTHKTNSESLTVPRTAYTVELNCVYLIEVLLAARSRAKIDKVTLDAVKLTAIFSKRRKIGSS